MSEDSPLADKGFDNVGCSHPRFGKTAVVHSLGRIVVGETEALRKAVLALNRRTVVLDLTGVDAIDGSGIGLLVFLQGWARAAGVDLQLVNPTRSVRELLELTNLDSVFKILSSEDAVSSHAAAVPSADETAAYQCD